MSDAPDVAATAEAASDAVRQQEISIYKEKVKGD